jgi:DNA-binding transcriptional MerR regulator
MHQRDRLLNIGAFAMLTGLSVDALRHYDEIGLLSPAEVDAATSYRRYRLEQVPPARRIRLLRAVELPIDEIRAIVDAGDEPTRAALRAHRARLEEQHRSLNDVIERVDDYIENGVRMQSKHNTSCRVAEINLGVPDVDVARRFYEAAFELEFIEDRHEDGFVHLMASFGSWPGDTFFLLNLYDGAGDPFRSGRASFGLVVDDLEVVHRRAVAAGGTEMDPPKDASGMPRFSTIIDPGNNLIALYQNA